MILMGGMAWSRRVYRITEAKKRQRLRGPISTLKYARHPFSSLPAIAIFLAFILGGCSTMPIQLAVWNPVQLAPEESSVYGTRFNLFYGKNQTVYGMDLGPVNRNETHGGGAQLGGFNAVGGVFMGLQVGGVNQVELAALGLQVAGSINHADTVQGLQLGSLNYGRRVWGMQLAGFNEARILRGFQLGVLCVGSDAQGFQVCPFVNVAERSRGFQIGLVNSAVNLSGVQIGLLNIHHSGLIGFFPGINLGFGGD
jgi:hypothetical protein